ncbi:MAG: hypothetical protein Q8880_08540, partial [Bacteroidota bacterium]|nr:hypothetical protein [Bacteroidota bacterium]
FIPAIAFSVSENDSEISILATSSINNFYCANNNISEYKISSALIILYSPKSDVSMNNLSKITEIINEKNKSDADSYIFVIDKLLFDGFNESFMFIYASLEV